MSLQRLGMLHRQFSSPSKASPEIPTNEDLTQDSKDVLIERLNDLILQLSETNFLEDGAVTNIHSQVDKIERLIRRQDWHTPQHSPGQLAPPREDDTLWGPPTPTHSIKMRLPRSSSVSESPFFTEPKINTSKADAVAKAAEDLASKMATTVAELQKRKEESDVSMCEILLEISTNNT